MWTRERAAGAALALALLGTAVLATPVPGATLGRSNSLEVSFRATEPISVRGVGCGASGTGSITLPVPLKGTSKGYGVNVVKPAVGDRDGFVRVTGVAVQDQMIAVTAVAEAAECSAEATGPPAEESWSASFAPDIRFKRRVQVRMQRSLIFDEAGTPALRPRALKLNPDESMRRIRWKRFGGRTAVGTATYRLRVPRGCNASRCPGLRKALRLNGRRMALKLHRVKRCGGRLEYTRVTVSVRGKPYIRTRTFC